jgi:GNAT superfamily N-acetyltransferase
MNHGFSMTYRLAGTSDVLKLSVLLWEQITEFDQHGTVLKDGYINDCHNHISNRLGKDLFCFIAEENGLIVSHIFILVTPKLPKLGRPNASYARLSSVRTIPSYRNKGIGGTLMNHVITFCKEKNAEEIIVWPSEDSIGYYKYAGFNSENKIMEIEFFQAD